MDVGPACIVQFVERSGSSIEPRCDQSASWRRNRAATTLWLDRDDLLRTSRRIDFLEVVPGWLLRGGRRPDAATEYSSLANGFADVSLNDGGIGQLDGAMLECHQ